MIDKIKAELQPLDREERMLTKTTTEAGNMMIPKVSVATLL